MRNGPSWESFQRVYFVGFDKLSKEEQTKILIHVIMHVFHLLGGGFQTRKPYVTQKRVERMYKKFVQAG